MEYSMAADLCLLLSRNYAAAFFRILLRYRTISASEAASRLDLHIKTAQDFLEGLLRHDIVSKREVLEQKRPYFRYSLEVDTIRIEVSLLELSTDQQDRSAEQWRIRERKDSGVVFKTAPRGDTLSAIQFFVGEGRSRKERRITLTTAQGRLLFHLPFPTEEPRSVAEIMKKAKVEETSLPEFVDIIELLEQNGIVDVIRA